MDSIEVAEIVNRIVEEIKSHFDDGLLNFEKKSLSIQSELAVFHAIQSLKNREAIDFIRVIYDENSHQFPDIVIELSDSYSLGIEVKSSSSNNNSWSINGNSVLGTTSIHVNDIFIIFIKFNQDGFAIKYKRYEDSISDVVVTHSPRYKIDLNLNPNESFFYKSGIKYEDIKNSDNPISLITNYFRREGKTAWWLGDNHDDNSSSAIILSWNDIDTETRKIIYGEAFVLFPELMNGSYRNKYNRLTKWLVAKYSIADSSLRDKFSAGGQISLKINDIEIKNVPQVFQTLTNHKENINLAFLKVNFDELKEFWQDYQPIQDNVEERKIYWYSIIKTHINDNNLLAYIRSLFKINTP